MATTAVVGVRVGRRRSGPGRVWTGWVLALSALLIAGALGTLVGAVGLSPGAIVLELADRLPLVQTHSGLSEREAAILWQLRLPRVVLGMLVGAMLSMAGTTYQGVFRNPLADPYLLGAAAGAGLGATIVIVAGGHRGVGPLDLLPVAAFAGALLAVAGTYVIGVGRGGARSATTLLLAGVAVASLLTAMQTYLQQQNQDTIREVYDWILGRLAIAGWRDVGLVLPWGALAAAVIMIHRPSLDVLSVGDAEASTLGLSVDRTRLILVVAATLATAAAVAVSGLIGFVGIIVPHTVRLLVGPGHRTLMPLAIIGGGAFLVLADVVARTVVAPAEIPIGVVTAMAGAPFFLVILGRRAT